MTSQKICHLWCDREGCFTEWIGASTEVAETRRLARREGWTTTGGSGTRTRLRDWCPKHPYGDRVYTPTSEGSP